MGNDSPKVPLKIPCSSCSQQIKLNSKTQTMLSLLIPPLPLVASPIWKGLVEEELASSLRISSLRPLPLTAMPAATGP